MGKKKKNNKKNGKKYNILMNTMMAAAYNRVKDKKSADKNTPVHDWDENTAKKSTIDIQSAKLFITEKALKKLYPEQMAKTNNKNPQEQTPKQLAIRKHVYNRLVYLNKNFNDTLVKNKIFAGKEEVLDDNIIDAAALIEKYKNSTDSDNEYLDEQQIKSDIYDDVIEWTKTQEQPWLTSVPCFTQGVLRYAKDRYMQWQIIDIDIFSKKLVIAIIDYTECEAETLDKEKYSYWTMNTNCLMNIQFDSENPERPKISWTSRDQYPDAPTINIFISQIYQCADYKRILNWSDEDINLWREIIVKYAIATEDYFINELKTTAQHEQTKMFLTYITLINYIIAQNKISRPKKQNRTEKHTLTKTITVDEVKPKERVVRNINMLSIKSEKPPRVPTEKTVVKYSVPSWTRRGHIRHYKSGKTVYIKESTPHRKCLKNKTPHNTKQTINFIDNSPRKDIQNDV